MKISRPVFSWALYDWANSAFTTTVITAFFPIAFKDFWNADASAELSTLRLGTINSAVSLVLALSAPLLGSVADQAAAKKKFLAASTIIGVIFTIALYFVAKGAWQLAAAFYLLSCIGFYSGNTFYDSLLVSVAKPKEMDRVSSFGFGLGYLGGGVLLAVNVLMVQKPELFGLANITSALKWSFVSVAVWWLVFSIPIFLWVEEPAPQAARLKGKELWLSGFRQVAVIFRDLKAIRPAFLFLLAYFFYMDGVHTIIRMAVDYGRALGFETGDLIKAILLVQFIGFPAAIIFGRVSERIGARNSIYVGLVVYASLTVWASLMTQRWEFFALAAGVGLVQGGVQALSRSLFANLIPHEKSGEFFGFYNMLGKFSSVLGPILMGITAYVSGEPRYSILSLLILFVIGGSILHFVRLPKSVEAQT